ncbi:MAG: ADP-forming succinate--CoA ligase subunit beta [Myxococcales bacterium]|nr:ADP-forming succinate--CoA ligase subunit beta [Myxococcales bacterium]
MKIHEYQAKALLSQYGVVVPKHVPAFTADEAKAAAAKLIAETGTEVVVVKSQIHAGGRGKGRFKEDAELGGVKVVKGADAAGAMAGRMLGNTLVTIQTGEAGKKVNRVLVEQGVDIDRELYVGALVDRARERVCVMACAEGGVEIEEVAARSPEKILKEWIDPATGFCGYQARRLAHGLGLEGNAFKNATRLLLSLGKAFVELDCSICEINPLVVTKSGDVMALDAKINLDDNAEDRHKATWSELHDASEEEPTELEAKSYNLSYVKLDGTIGCMVNGAGLAMATMDIIKQFGGEPANFLDVGGSADAKRVAAAFKIILADDAVKGIFVNIFGGIVFCDRVAQGVVDAAKEVGITVPLVVRLEGTNVEAGRKILAESGLTITTASDMADGAKKIVELAAKA